MNGWIAYINKGNSLTDGNTGIRQVQKIYIPNEKMIINY